MKNSPRIICLGEILVDCLADQLGREQSDVSSWTAYPGGAPANVACALAKLGTAAAFIGCVGQDHSGDELISLLQETDVNIIGVQRCSETPTRTVYVTRSLNGERHFAGFGDIDSSKFADTQLSAEQLPNSLLMNADFLVIGTLGLAYPKSRAAMAKAIHLIQQAKAKLFIDVNWRPVFWRNSAAAKLQILEILEQADLIKCTDEEAQWLFETQNPIDIAHIFPKVKGVLVTAGEKGCKYSLGQYQGQVDAFLIDVTDTTGAGDSFVAGFLHYFCLKEKTIFTDPDIARNAIVYASAVGALTTTKSGAIAAQPTAREVDKFLNRKLSD